MIKAEESFSNHSIPTAEPALVDGNDGSGSSNNNNENVAKLAQLMSFGNGVAQYVGKIDPFQGLTNAADATTKIKKEAKNLFNPTEFSKPKTRTEWMERVSANASYFRLTYMIWYAFTGFYFVLTSPFLLFELGLIGGLWFLFFKMNKAEDVVKIGSYELGRKEKMLVLVPLSTFVAFFGGLLSTIIYILFMGTVVVGSHASFRHPIQPDPLDELEQASSLEPQFV